MLLFVNFRVVRSTPPRTCTVCPVLYIAFPSKFVCTSRFALKKMDDALGFLRCNFYVNVWPCGGFYSKDHGKEFLSITLIIGPPFSLWSETFSQRSEDGRGR